MAKATSGVFAAGINAISGITTGYMNSKATVAASQNNYQSSIDTAKINQATTLLSNQRVGNYSYKNVLQQTNALKFTANQHLAGTQFTANSSISNNKLTNTTNLQQTRLQYKLSNENYKDRFKFMESQYREIGLPANTFLRPQANYLMANGGVSTSPAVGFINLGNSNL